MSRELAACIWYLELGERAKLALDASESFGRSERGKKRGVPPYRLFPISRAHIRGHLAKLRQTNCGHQSGVVSQSGRTINIELSRWPKN